MASLLARPALRVPRRQPAMRRVPARAGQPRQRHRYSNLARRSPLPEEPHQIQSDICHGKPRIAGTRLPVSQIVGMLAAGDTVEELFDAPLPEARRHLRRPYLRRQPRQPRPSQGYEQSPVGKSRTTNRPRPTVKPNRAPPFLWIEGVGPGEEQTSASVRHPPTRVLALGIRKSRSSRSAVTGSRDRATPPRTPQNVGRAPAPDRKAPPGPKRVISAALKGGGLIAAYARTEQVHNTPNAPAQAPTE